MRSKLVGSFALALFCIVACGGSDDTAGTGGKGGKGGTSGKGGSGTGATGTGATGTGATGTGGTGTGGTGIGGTATGGVAGGGPCVPVACQGHVYQCGDCTDNDGDGKIDSLDPDCWGACQDNETGFKGNIPGQANPPCMQDCYFDQDSGAGNDQCYWDHRCDPNEVAPNFPPEGSGCPYDANTKVVESGGAPLTCDQALNTQKDACQNFCGPLVPNGCDCFGCCVIPGAPTPVWLGSTDTSGAGTCDINDAADPSKCHPCEQVKGCLNTCEHCELCIGKPTLPSDCTGTGGSGGTGGSAGGGGTPTGGSGGTGGSCILPLCPTGVQSCGVSCAPACPQGYYCVTGCCAKAPA